MAPIVTPRWRRAVALLSGASPGLFLGRVVLFLVGSCLCRIATAEHLHCMLALLGRALQAGAARGQERRRRCTKGIPRKGALREVRVLHDGAGAVGAEALLLARAEKPDDERQEVRLIGNHPRLEGAVHDLLEDLLRRISREGQSSCAALIHQHTEAPPVHAHAIPLMAHHFRRHVVGRAHHAVLHARLDVGRLAGGPARPQQHLRLLVIIVASLRLDLDERPAA
mmetsp:Transcript_26947/g.84549  ORF Transcript_26947/g.84549 Transcript_26947/m.84549 type:complete len:225 (-) Transcript_26947:1056-1730(-)